MAPEKRKLTLDEQLKVLEERGAYMHYPPSPSPDMHPRVDDNSNVIDARTTAVSPASSPKDLTHASETPDSATSVGRGNDPQRSGGTRIPPSVIGLQLPQPAQLGGSNSPMSNIKQLPDVNTQAPGQVTVLWGDGTGKPRIFSTVVTIRAE